MKNSELLEDVQDFDRIKKAIENGEEELIPAEVVNALLDGDNPIKVWREYRGFSQSQLAEKAGISIPIYHSSKPVSLTGLDFTRHSRPVFTTDDRPMFTTHSRPVFTT